MPLGTINTEEGPFLNYKDDTVFPAVSGLPSESLRICVGHCSYCWKTPGLYGFFYRARKVRSVLLAI